MLIVFEGIDGSGKTTLAKLFYEYLKNKGYKVVYEHEPNDVDIRKKITKLLKEATIEDLNDENFIKGLALLFAADRHFHQRKIKKYLKEGYIVICDRYYHSSLAYQTLFDKITADFILKINNSIVKPDYTFIVLVPVEVAIERLKTKEEKHIFTNQEVLKKVYQNYLKLKNILKEEKIIYLDSRKSPKELLEEVIKWTGL